MKEPYNVWLIDMNKSYIFNNYNLNRVLTAIELAELSKTYIDNQETIIVMMDRKRKTPQQPPAWFKEFAAKVEAFIIEQKQFNKTILKRLDQHDKLFKQHGWIK